MTNYKSEANTEERKAFLVALVSCDGIGAKTALKILNFCQKKGLDSHDFLVNRYHLWRDLSLSEKTTESIKKFKKEHSIIDNLNNIYASGIQVLTFDDSSYPKLLLATEDFPVVLFVKSKLSHQNLAWQKIFANTISVVGTRKITAYGQLVIKQLLPPLISSGKTIVSGFMYGVDLIAAQKAIEHHGHTIAVLGYGFDYCFPVRQKKIMQQFFEQEAIFLSEFSPSTKPRAANFVIRNRIVAGLSKATIVIEAASRSGSHITASYANNYGRLVMAVPGPINNPFSAGTKDLINQGATLVNSATDIFKEIKEDYHLSLQDSVEETTIDQSSKLLLQNLTFYPELTFEDLLKNTKISFSKLNQLLFNLELQGKIIKKWGKYCLVS